MTRPAPRLLAAFAMLAVAPALPAQNAEPLSPPPQDQGLPYTRSASTQAVQAIRGGFAAFPGSRYGYAQGIRVRLDDTDLLRAEAVVRGGTLYVPAPFAALFDAKKLSAPPVPADLAPIADRWVYAPSELAPTRPAATATGAIDIRGTRYLPFEEAARRAGLKVTLHPRGFLFAGPAELRLPSDQPHLADAIVTLFDTPEKFADPAIAARAIPQLARQKQWTDHVKTGPDQIAHLSGTETEWPTAPKSAHSTDGFNARLLGSKVPPPGVYPRLLFSPDDVPSLAKRLRSTEVGQMSLIEMEELFKKSWWDESTSDGAVFKKLSTGDLAGLEWDAPPGTPLSGYPATFKGQKPGIHNSHVAYVPECLTAMALYALLTQDDTLGPKVAAAVANYFKLREPLLDEWLAISDSEFGSSTTDSRGGSVNYGGNGAKTHWRNIHGLAQHMNLGPSLDFAGKWMSAEQKDGMRRFIAKATYGRRSYGQDAPVRFRDVNWVGWDLPHYLAVTAIEGLPGFDREAAASGAETVRAFCDWGVDPAGVVYESNGKTPGSFQFILLSMATLARRGDNLFAHPHWRRLLEGQVQMTSPTGRVTVNCGTQYSPYSRQGISLGLALQLKGFYPDNRLPDYLVSRATASAGSADDEFGRTLPRAGFDPAAYRAKVVAWKRHRLPSITYPGFVRGVLYDGDVRPTTRADLDLPLDFDAPVHGVFSSYSDRTPDAAWINMMVRPNHYLGAGHHHADAGMFHFSALGVDWFTESPFSQAYAGKYHNLALVDGTSQPEPIEGQILGYNGPATYLGAKSGPAGAAASADLTYAYSWRWMTQPPQVWNEALTSLPWEIDPLPESKRIWAGTARYKMRPWWATYNYSNFIPTLRAPFNPMRHAFRTTALVRGPHPYAIVADDLKKDDAPRLYQWVAMLNGGVRKADLPGLAPHQIALAFREGDPKLDAPIDLAPLPLQPGEPLLLVTALGMDASGDPAMPLLEVASLEGPADRKGVPQHYARLAVNRRATEAHFRILLTPIRAGQTLPAITTDGGQAAFTAQWQGQRDTIRFTPAPGGRSLLEVARNGQAVVASPRPAE